MALTVYTAGEVLTASSLNANLTFAATNPVASPAGVVQVKSTTKSDTFTTTSNTLVDVTGLSVSITPTSASNKILVLVAVYASSDPSTSSVMLELLRGSTAIAIGDAAGSRDSVTAQGKSVANFDVFSLAVTFLDSPATTAATTYKIQIRSNSANQSSHINRAITDTDAASSPRLVSTITVMEVTP